MVYYVVKTCTEALARPVAEYDVDSHHHHQNSNSDNTNADTDNNHERGSMRRDRGLISGMLDPSGPDLNKLCPDMIIFFKLTGSINWSEKHLFLSLAYKLIILFLIMFNGYVWTFWRIYQLGIIKENYKNPVFISIIVMSILGATIQLSFATYLSSFKLSPLLKILTTKQLCFIDLGTQKLLNRDVIPMVIILIYHSILTTLLCSKNFNEFWCEFYLPKFILQVIAYTCFNSNIFGIPIIDNYIRFSFGHWLFSLKYHLDHRFKNSEANSMMKTINNDEQHYLTFDEIEGQLNNMDDHLESLRNSQSSNLTFISINSFLCMGALILLGYHCIAIQSNFYHGIIFMLLMLNYSLAVSTFYLGDAYLSTALESLVRTIEDEYFIQDLNKSNRLSIDFNYCIIKRKNVLFCNEFSEQFKEHLATPWSKFSFISHVNIVLTFFTLAAAQTMLDHEYL